MEPLSPAARRDLRAKAHHLEPVVTVGHHGLTPPVLHEIDLALLAEHSASENEGDVQLILLPPDDLDARFTIAVPSNVVPFPVSRRDAESAEEENAAEPQYGSHEDTKDTKTSREKPGVGPPLCASCPSW